MILRPLVVGLIDLAGEAKKETKLVVVIDLAGEAKRETELVVVIDIAQTLNVAKHEFI